MENPPASILDRIFPDGVADWTKFSAGDVSIHMYDMAAFADAWAPLERRWEAEGAPALTHAIECVVILECNVAIHLWIESGGLICRLRLQTSRECNPTSRTRVGSWSLSSTR